MCLLIVSVIQKSYLRMNPFDVSNSRDGVLLCPYGFKKSLQAMFSKGEKNTLCMQIRSLIHIIILKCQVNNPLAETSLDIQRFS